MKSPSVIVARRSALFALGLGLLITSLPGQQAPRLSVLTYNIHIGTGMDKKLDLARTAAVIKSAAPDLVALQEVDRRTRRTGGVDQAIELARLTGMHPIFGKALDLEGIDQNGGDYGNAILSRFPIRRSQNRALPNTPKFEPRAVLEIEIDWPHPNGARIPLRFFATHFDVGSEPDRIASAKALNELAGLDPDVPAILAGDLNSVPASEPLKLLAKQWAVASGADEIATSPANAPRRQIDYILFRPARAWRVIDIKALDEAVASDHRPVLAVLEYAH